MSFICLSCGRQRAGSAIPEVCSECRPKQSGRAALTLRHFPRVDDQLALEALETVLGEAQNGPPDGTGDGSITPRRWNHLARLLKAAIEFNAALDAATPHEHDPDW